MEKRLSIIFLALIFTLAIPALGYITLGTLPAVIFLVGFLGGFVLWLGIPMRTPWTAIKAPYFLTLVLFLLHRGLEEQFFGFFPALAEITGVQIPDFFTTTVIIISLLSIAWVLSPLLIIKRHALGYYGAWTFFFAMGVSEIAHFIFPFLRPEPYGYFPGMATALFLIPAAWWGMWRLTHGHGDRNAF